MVKQLIIIFFFCSQSLLIAQVGINTTDPKGALDITTTNNMGLVLPRVTSVEEVTDGQGNPPVEGTTVFDLSRGSVCFYQNSKWACIENSAANGGAAVLSTAGTFDGSSQDYYFKASNTGNLDFFGQSVSISGDGNTLAIGAPGEASSATGINGDQTINSTTNSGAVYVFTNNNGVWAQQAYIKASNTFAGAQFGFVVSLSDDGNTLAVGAPFQSGLASGINGPQNPTGITNSGAVYVFSRAGTAWAQEAYIKASTPRPNNFFGHSVSVSNNGNTLAVGAWGQASNSSGINSDETNTLAGASGAVYLFTRTATSWSQQAFMKASNTNANDRFGWSVSVSGDGNTLAVGAFFEDSSSTGINGNQANNSGNNSGAVYIFIRAGAAWSQQAYIKASNTDNDDLFGYSVSLSGVGNTLVVGAYGEDGVGTGINGPLQATNGFFQAGAAYIFRRVATAWSQEAYVKATNNNAGYLFGWSTSVNEDGNTIVIGAPGERSQGTGINGNQNTGGPNNSGAAYVFHYNGTQWTQEAYIKANVVDSGDRFGYAVSMSNNGDSISVGAYLEDSGALGVGGDAVNNLLNNSGAGYVFSTF